MRRHLGIRWKVLAVLGLPVLVLALTAGGLSLQALVDARTGRQVGAFADAQDEVTTAITALERERLLSTTPGATPSQLRSARAVTDRETVALASVLRTTEITQGLPDAASVLDGLRTASNRLADLRRTVDKGGAVGPMRAGYASIIDQHVELAGAVGDLLSDRMLAQRFSATSVLHRAVEASAEVHLIGLDMVQAGTATAAQQSALAVALADHTRALAEFHAGGSMVGAGVQQQATAQTERFTALAAALQASGTGPVTVSATAWTATAEAQATALGRLADAVAADAADQAESSAESTRQRAALVSGAAVALVGLMVLLALIQSRQITAPLRRLADAATRTREDLPSAVEAISLHGADSAELPTVDVAARDEVGAVATAFRDVQDTVLEIAHEQAQLRATLADTFVNVARRNQVLLARQLSFIDRLERSEEDPDALDNLFRLDHLATRMRRNAESLLVLAGIDSGRRARSTMTLSDVIRTAVSEVEHYDRVQLDIALNPLVVAHLALPTAHLIAELIENATTFSDPNAPVRVSTGSSPNGVAVRVTDRGLGMSDDDLAAANARLEDLGATSTVVPVHTAGAQRLGLYVVARLAARLGAAVRLEHGTGGGIVAVVELPAVVFVEGSTPQGTGRVQRIDVTSVEQPPAIVVEPSEAALSLEPLEPLEPLESLEPLVPAEPPVLAEPPILEPPVAIEPVAPEPIVSEPMLPEPVLPEPVLPEPVAPGLLVPEPSFDALVQEPRPVESPPPGLPRRRPGATIPAAPAPAAFAADPAAALPTVPTIPTVPAVPAVPAAAAAPATYGLELPSGVPMPAVPVVPPPPGPIGSAPTETWPTATVPAPVQAGPSQPPAAPPATSAVPFAIPPVTMDVLPQHARTGGFSLGRLGRRPRPGRVNGSVPPAAAPPSGAMPSGSETFPAFPPAPPAQHGTVGTGLPPSAGPFGAAPGLSGAAFPGVATNGVAVPPLVPHPAPAEASAARSELASTALSELSMLASYRPELDAASPATLARRSPAATPPAPAPIVPEPSLVTGRAPRTAESVRSTVAGFLTGAQRGRGQSGLPPSPPGPVPAPQPPSLQQPPPAQPTYPFAVPQSTQTDPTPQEYR